MSIRSHREGNTLQIVLDRPEKRNAFTMEMFDGLASAVESVADDESLRAVVIRGEGPVFSAGVDVDQIRAMHEMSALKARTVIRAWQRAIESVETIEVPVIARLHGHVVGGALELASACDFRVAADDARLSMPEARLGTLPDGGCVRLVRHIGLGRAKELIMAGQVLSAAEAERIGLVTAVSPLLDLDQAVEALIAQITTLAPRGIGLAKHVLNHGSATDLRTAMELESLASGPLYATDDVGEGCRAFSARRPPRFSL